VTDDTLSVLLSLARSGDRDAAQDLYRLCGTMLANGRSLPREVSLYLAECLLEIAELKTPSENNAVAGCLNLMPGNKTQGQVAAEIDRVRAVADALQRPDVTTHKDAYRIAAEKLSEEKDVSDVTVKRAWLKWSKPGPLGFSFVDFMRWNERKVDTMDAIFKACAKRIDKPVRELKQRKDLQDHRDVAIFLCRRLLAAKPTQMAVYLDLVRKEPSCPAGEVLDVEAINDALERVYDRRDKDPEFDKQFRAILLTWPEADQFKPRQLTSI